MQHLGPPEMLAILAVAIILFGGKGIPRFRSGPGSPSHPLLANDSWFLTRKRKQKIGA